MKSMKVKELMVPLAEYATVSQEATLSEAVMALKEAQRNVDRDRDKHRAVLVLDDKGGVVGKLSQWDVIKGIEPKYDSIKELKDTSRYGFSPDFIRSMLDQYGLWRKPLDHLCRKAAEQKVKEMMVTPHENEYIREDASLDEAIHQLVIGRHQSLLVTRGEGIVGILRLSDVFKQICDKVEACGI